MIVTAHQPNFLMGESVVCKIAAADRLIWMDSVQYVKEGYINRNRLPDGSWITVPVGRQHTNARIKDVWISPTGWERKMVNRIRNAFPRMDPDDPLLATIRGPFLMLVNLNRAVFDCVASTLGIATPAVCQSTLAIDAPSISEELAAMVGEVGGDTYLSGPSGKNYLDERPFRARGIQVRYWHHDGPNPSVLERYARG